MSYIFVTRLKIRLRYNILFIIIIIIAIFILVLFIILFRPTSSIVIDCLAFDAQVPLVQVILAATASGVVSDSRSPPFYVLECTFVVPMVVVDAADTAVLVEAWIGIA